MGTGETDHGNVMKYLSLETGLPQPPGRTWRQQRSVPQEKMVDMEGELFGIISS